MKVKCRRCVKYLAQSVDRAFGHPVLVLAIHLLAPVLAAILYRVLPVLMRALPRSQSRVLFGCGVDGVGQVGLARFHLALVRIETTVSG